MAPIAVEAAWTENAGLGARAVAAGTPAVRAGAVPPAGRDMAAWHDDPAARGGRTLVRTTMVAQEAPAFHHATPCATGTGAIPGFARLACVPPIALPATRPDQVATPCAMIAGAASDAAIALFRTA